MNKELLKKKYMRVAEVKAVYSIKQGVIYRLIKERKIKSISIAEGGARRGSRLICVESLEAFLDRLASEQEQLDETASCLHGIVSKMASKISGNNPLQPDDNK